MNKYFDKVKLVEKYSLPCHIGAAAPNTNVGFKMMNNPIGFVDKYVWEQINIFQNLNLDSDVIDKYFYINNESLRLTSLDYFNNPDLVKLDKLVLEDEFFLMKMVEVPILTFLNEKGEKDSVSCVVFIGEKNLKDKGSFFIVPVIQNNDDILKENIGVKYRKLSKKVMFHGKFDHVLFLNGYKDKIVKNMENDLNTLEVVSFFANADSDNCVNNNNVFFEKVIEDIYNFKCNDNGNSEYLGLFCSPYIDFLDNGLRRFGSVIKFTIIFVRKDKVSNKNNDIFNRFEEHNVSNKVHGLNDLEIDKINNLVKQQIE